MKIAITGLQKKGLIEYIAEKFSRFEIVEKDPEVVITYGGDGTLLYGEREYPGIPKAMIRNSQICKLCTDIAKDTILQLLNDGQYTITEHIKLQAEAKGQTLMALNDVMVGHPRVNGTLRMKVLINGVKYGDELLADGVIVSTPLGSTGYYQSVTNSNFQSGIGLAFNNAVNFVNHVNIQETAEVQVEIARGPGVVVTDNDEYEIPLSTGDVVTIRASKEVARLVEFPKEYSRYSVRTSANRIPLGLCQICQQKIV